MALTAEQLEQRKHGLTATDLARIVEGRGLEVWCEKRGIAEPFESTSRMRAGQRLQRTIGEWAAEERGLLLGREDVTRVHPVEQWLMATPDFDCWKKDLDPECGDPGCLETKNVGQQREYEWGLVGDDVPVRVRVQVEIQMAVTEREWAVVAALIGGHDLRVYDLTTDAELRVSLVELGREWWDRHIIHGEQPALDGSTAAHHYLAKKYPRGSKDIRKATPEEERLIHALRDARAGKRGMETLIGRLEAEVKE